jgi:F-type H+-transporting ATPase subunit b
MIFNAWTFLFEVLNFLVLVAILRRLLYRPLRAAIDRRRLATAQSQAEAEKARQEAEALHRRLDEQVAALDEQRQELIRSARAQAEAERRTLMVDAEHALQRRREEAEQHLERDRAEALQSLQAELVQSAVALAERLLRQAADSTLQRQLAGRLVEELRRIPEDERERLRGEWEDDDTAVLETAVELNGELLRAIQGALDSLAGRAVGLSVQSRPALLGGVRLQVGGHVWDASLADRLGDLGATTPGRTGP